MGSGDQSRGELLLVDGGSNTEHGPKRAVVNQSVSGQPRNHWFGGCYTCTLTTIHPVVVIIKLGMDLQIKEDKEENVKYGTNFNSFIKVIITFTPFNSCSKAVFFSGTPGMIIDISNR